jgi:hypothetical protein
MILQECKGGSLGERGRGESKLEEKGGNSWGGGGGHQTHFTFFTVLLLPPVCALHARDRSKSETWNNNVTYTNTTPGDGRREEENTKH